MTNERMLEHVNTLRRMLGDLPEPVHFEGCCGQDDITGKVFEAMFNAGAYDAIYYTVSRHLDAVSDEILKDIRYDEELRKKWETEHAE